MRKRASVIIRADGSGLKRLTPWQPHTGEHSDFAPNHAQLRPGERFLTSLFVMASHGTGVRQVTKEDGASDPDWLVPGR